MEEEVPCLFSGLDLDDLLYQCPRYLKEYQADVYEETVDNTDDSEDDVVNYGVDENTVHGRIS